MSDHLLARRNTRYLHLQFVARTPRLRLPPLLPPRQTTRARLPGSDRQDRTRHSPDLTVNCPCWGSDLGSWLILLRLASSYALGGRAQTVKRNWSEVGMGPEFTHAWILLFWIGSLDHMIEETNGAVSIDLCERDGNREVDRTGVASRGHVRSSPCSRSSTPNDCLVLSPSALSQLTTLTTGSQRRPTLPPRDRPPPLERDRPDRHPRLPLFPASRARADTH